MIAPVQKTKCLSSTKMEDLVDNKLLLKKKSLQNWALCDWQIVF